MEAFNETVALRTAYLRGSMLDGFELQEQFVRVVIGPAAELAAMVREDGLDARLIRLEVRQHIGVEHMHSGQRQLARVEPAPAVAAEAVDDRLQIDLPDALQVADKEGVDRDQLAGVVDLDLALAKLRAEALSESPRDSRRLFGLSQAVTVAA